MSTGRRLSVDISLINYMGNSGTDLYITRRNSIMNMDGAFLFGGRYNTPEIFGVLYLSDSSEGCVTGIFKQGG